MHLNARRSANIGTPNTRQQENEKLVLTNCCYYGASEKQRTGKTPSVVRHIEISIVDCLGNFCEEITHLLVRNVVLFFHVFLYLVKVVNFTVLCARLDRLENCCTK